MIGGWPIMGLNPRPSRSASCGAGALAHVGSRVTACAGEGARATFARAPLLRPIRELKQAFFNCRPLSCDD
jgi:hypothetical protein